MRILMVLAALAGLGMAPAAAQNLSLRAPDWAQALLSSDIIPTLGGRAALAEADVAASARVTIAPLGGGVARVIRFDAREDGAIIALRRFTGHPGTGWWLWGPDTPHIIRLTNAQRDELIELTRGAASMAARIGAQSNAQSCASGEQAYIEHFAFGRSASSTRACLSANDAVGQLAMRLSEIAGSRDDEALIAAAREELLTVDRAFAAMAAEAGRQAAFARYVSGRAMTAPWPEGALSFTPQTARVSTRGDMGWTTGTATITANGQRTERRYIRTWTRDFEGNWRVDFDAPLAP